MTRMPVIHISDRAQFEATIKNHSLVVVDFFSTDCAPCANLAPIYEAAAEKYPEIPFLKIMRQDNRELAESLQVMSSPSVLFFKDGQMMDQRLCGNITYQELDEAVKLLVGQG